MELTDKLYNKLFKHALYLIKDEDIAAEAVNSVFLKIHIYSGNTDNEFFGWSGKIIENKRKDFLKKLHKQKIDLFINKVPFTSKEAFKQIVSNSEVEQDNYRIEQIKSVITQEEYEFMVKYKERCSVTDKKHTNQQKLKFLRLKNKVINKLVLNKK